MWQRVPTSCMCKKQAAVSRSTTESEVISLDAGLRMDGIPALDLWDLVIDVLRSSPSPIGIGKPDAIRSPCEKHPRILCPLRDQVRILILSAWGRPDGLCQSANVVGMERPGAPTLSTDDVHISQEGQKEGSERIGLEKPGAPERGGDATKRDVALNYISDQRKNLEFKENVVMNFQQQIMVLGDVKFSVISQVFTTTENQIAELQLKRVIWPVWKIELGRTRRGHVLCCTKINT